jgi:hypothetical protein
MSVVYDCVRFYNQYYIIFSSEYCINLTKDICNIYQFLVYS